MTDEDRFTALYRNYSKHVERYARRRATEVAAADVVADVFLVAWRRLSSIPAGRELPWLYGAARGILANRVRGVQRSRRLAERVTHSAPGHSGDHADGVVSRLAIAEAFDLLSSRDQEALRLVAWEQLSLRDAAAAFGCSTAAFAMRLHRARQRLRANLVTDRPPHHDGGLPQQVTKLKEAHR